MRFQKDFQNTTMKLKRQSHFISLKSHQQTFAGLQHVMTYESQTLQLRHAFPLRPDSRLSKKQPDVACGVSDSDPHHIFRNILDTQNKCSLS